MFYFFWTKTAYYWAEAFRMKRLVALNAPEEQRGLDTYEELGNAGPCDALL